MSQIIARQVRIKMKAEKVAVTIIIPYKKGAAGIVHVVFSYNAATDISRSQSNTNDQSYITSAVTLPVIIKPLPTNRIKDLSTYTTKNPGFDFKATMTLSTRPMTCSFASTFNTLYSFPPFCVSLLMRCSSVLVTTAWPPKYADEFRSILKSANSWNISSRNELVDGSFTEMMWPKSNTMYSTSARYG